MRNQNIDEFVIIGGARGVGKSTIAERYCELTGAKYFHPGDWFLKYPEKIDFKILEGISIGEIIQAKKPLIIDVHYAVYVKPFGWIKGFCDQSLELLARENSQIRMYLIELPPKDLYERRIKDAKKRKLDIEIIKEELNQNSRAFEHFIKELSKCSKLTAERIINYDLKDSVRKIMPGE